MTKTFNLNKNYFYIDGFYYGVSDEEIKDNVPCIQNDDTVHPNGSDSHGMCDCKIILFTNNPSIPVTQLVIPDKEDEIEKLAEQIYPISKEYKENYKSDYTDFNTCWKEGYKANPNTFTDDDMIGFAAFAREQEWICTISGEGWEFKHEYIDKKLLSLYLKSKEKLIESFDVNGEFICKNGHSMNYQTACVYPHCEEPNYWQPKLINNKIAALNVKYKN